MINNNTTKYLQKFNYLLHNKIILYVVFFVSLIQIVYYITFNRYNLVICFILISGLTYFFNKNMIIILMVGIIMTFMIDYGIKRKYILTKGFEGLKNIEGGEEEEEEENIETVEMGKKEGMTDEKPEEKGKDTDKVKELEKEIKEGVDDFKKINDQILKGINEMKPLVAQAQTFMSRIEEYKNLKGTTK